MWGVGDVAHKAAARVCLHAEHVVRVDLRGVGAVVAGVVVVTAVVVVAVAVVVALVIVVVA